jgi:hypothetical protein
MITTQSLDGRGRALNHVRFRTAMYSILNCLEFRTNHESYAVHGVVHGVKVIRIKKLNFKAF